MSTKRKQPGISPPHHKKIHVQNKRQGLIKTHGQEKGEGRGLLDLKTLKR